MVSRATYSHGNAIEFNGPTRPARAVHATLCGGRPPPSALSCLTRRTPRACEVKSAENRVEKTKLSWGGPEHTASGRRVQPPHRRAVSLTSLTHDPAPSRLHPSLHSFSSQYLDVGRDQIVSILGLRHGRVCELQRALWVVPVAAIGGRGAARGAGARPALTTFVNRAWHGSLLLFTNSKEREKEATRQSQQQRANLHPKSVAERDGGGGGVLDGGSHARSGTRPDQSGQRGKSPCSGLRLASSPGLPPACGAAVDPLQPSRGHWTPWRCNLL